MTNITRRIALWLAVIMLFGVIFTSCGKTQQGTGETDTQSSSQSNESVTESNTENTIEEETLPLNDLGIKNGQMIEYANYLTDKADAYYGDGKRSFAVIENMNMTLTHALNGNLTKEATPNLVNSITNKNGGVYLQNTMDAFVKITDSRVYYASDWITGSSFNIYRGGYYYQEAHITDQGFADADAILNGAYEVDLTKIAATDSNHVNVHHDSETGTVSFVVNNCADPGVQTNAVKFASRDYNALLLTIKTEESQAAQFFFRTAASGYSQALSKHISLIPGDNFHTYVIRLDDIKGYKGTITGLRFDVGSAVGENVEIGSIKAINLDENAVPVRFDRGLHAYSDKLHQELHFVTTAETELVSSYGMVTHIDKNTVAKLIVKDSKGTHETLEGIDWSSAEYVGFDIKNVGIFGYILAKDEGSGNIRVTLDGDRYTITQEVVLDKNTTLPDNTHFYMGHRIYTDTKHSFSAFLKEAEIERNPLSDSNFSVRYVSDAPEMFSKYVGYDPLRGAYRISINSTDFNTAYYTSPNRHFRAYTTITGDELDRKIYLYTKGSTGALECAALLDENDMMLPIPLQVIKNFGNDGEESIFLHDEAYSETYMPLLVDAGSSQTFSILNLYQNWGQFPLKQISWIQYYAPYYHLSTGVTETNCIAPMYGANGFKLVNDVDNGIVYEFHVTSGKTLQTLPDFRAMSALLWPTQPQHNSCAAISWLEYVTADGAHYASEFVRDTIDSAGPTYADMTLDYVSDDGRITATYRHAEMPQTDENRTYYSLRYDVNDTVEIENFLEDFNILEINSRSQTYEKMGYLDADNKSVIQAASKSAESRFIKLGNNYPYFDFFYTPTDSSNKATNYAVIIKSWDIVLGGKKYDGCFMLEEWFSNTHNYSRLSLDLGKVTLQKGDYIDIDLILLPWGKADATDDSNVLQVRQDSCIDPFKVEAKIGSVISDAYLPKVTATDNQAEFTLSGGHNNAVVRVYGFDTLTRPEIYELVDGEWVEYQISSEKSPDKAGYAHYYDGYCVHYDGNGSFSYSFVISIDNGAPRTFKVITEEFEPYPEVETGVVDTLETDPDDDIILEEETKPNGEGAPVLYYSAQDIYVAAKRESDAGQATKLQKIDLNVDKDGTKYITLWAEGGAPEAYFAIEKNESSIQSAPYFAFKYRTTSKGYHESWLNSDKSSPNGSFKEGYVSDGEWHYFVINAADILNAYNGKVLKYFRFDFMNLTTTQNQASSVDIAYVGFFKTEAEALRFELGDEYKTADELKAENNKGCIDPSSGYTESKLAYGCSLDMINGMGENGEKNFGGRGGNSQEGVDRFDYAISTVKGSHLVFTGWTVVDGGIEKYVWSADGGKTWHDAIGYNCIGPGSGAGTAHYNVIQKKIGTHTFSSNSPQNSTYSGAAGAGENVAGLAANLEAYKGQTVEVIFAAVPVEEPNSLCLIACVSQVTVLE